MTPEERAAKKLERRRELGLAPPEGVTWPLPPPPLGPKCAICGCTRLDACRPTSWPMACAWVSKRPPVCSACFTFLMNVRDLERLGAILKVCGIDVTEAVLNVWVRAPAPARSRPRRGGAA